MVKWKDINWLAVASLGTALYFAIFIRWIGYDRIARYPINNSLNEVGDFIAGFFSPLAFVWLVAAVLTQRQELTDTREQFAENQRVVDAQLTTINEQSALLQQQHILAEETAKKTYRLSLFEQRFAIYNELIDVGSSIEKNRMLGSPFFALQSHDLRRIIDKSNFVFGSSVLNYLDVVDRKCREIIEFRVSRDQSWEQDIHHGLPSGPIDIRNREMFDNMMAAFTQLLTSEALRQRMWKEMHVSDS